MHLVRHGACQPLGVHVVLFLAHVSRRRRRRRGGLRSRGCGLAVFEEERLDADEEPLDRVGIDFMHATLQGYIRYGCNYSHSALRPGSGFVRAAVGALSRLLRWRSAW